MAYRIDRMSKLVRDVVSDAISNKIWDPRVSHFTSVTRVELSHDLRNALVYVSVMGTDAEATTTMKGLGSARGMIQTLLARRLDVRHCPILQFRLDKGIKAAIEIIRQIDSSHPDGLTADACSDRPSPDEARQPEPPRGADSAPEDEEANDPEESQRSGAAP